MSDHDTSKSHPPCARRGFTLIELLSVMFIMGVLAGLIVGVSAFANVKARRAKTTAKIQELKNKLEEFKLVKGGYPPLAAGDDIEKLMETDLTNWVSADFGLKDPWGNALVYVCDESNRKVYQLYSKGPDGKAGDPDTDDDNIQ